MSLMDKIKAIAATGQKWEHTAAAWFAKDLQTFHNVEPNLVAIGDRVFPYVKRAIQIAVQVEGGSALSDAAGSLLDAIHAKIDSASALLFDFGANPTVLGAIGEIKDHAGQIADTLGLNSPAALDALKKAIDNLSALGTAVQGAIDTLTPTKQAPAQS